MNLALCIRILGFAAYWLQRSLPALRELAIGMGFVAGGIVALDYATASVIAHMRLVLNPWGEDFKGVASLGPFGLALLIGCGSYFLCEFGLRRLVRITGPAQEHLRSAGEWLVPSCAPGKRWMLAAAIALFAIILAAAWMIATLFFGAALRQGQITLWLVIVAVLLAAFLFCASKVGDLSGGGVGLGFQLLLWFGLMRGAFTGAAGCALALTAVALDGIEVPPIALVPLALCLACWWFARNRFEDAMGWWGYGGEDESYV